MDLYAGVVDWYDAERGEGVIRGYDGEEYFVHYTNLSSNFTPVPGQRLIFRVRPRRRQGMEAFQVAPLTTDDHSATTTVTQSTDTAATVRAVAAEALELQRLRKKGLATPTETLPVGARVVHARYGLGTVVLSASEIVSVRFDRSPGVVRDLPRGEVQPTTDAVEQPAAPVATDAAKSPDSQSLSAARTDIATVIQGLARDAQIALTQGGLEADGVYLVEDETPSAQPMVGLDDLDPTVAAAYARAQGITRFYSHQAEARRHLLAGKHIVIATPTASGKTESYNPTILETLLTNPQATALYVFPLVALGFDQVERLKRLNEALPENKRLRIGILNRNVEKTAKKETLADKNRIVVTTPETLHYRLLPRISQNWHDFFAQLRYVVLDEAHVYKGFFGSNMALIVRRLLARSMRLGNPDLPQIIIASATVRDPRALAHQLTGLPADHFAVVDRSGAPQPRRHFLALPLGVRGVEVEDIVSDLLDATTVDARSGERRPVRTIVFIRSINEVKRATEQVKQVLRRQKRDGLAEAVADFYADKADKQDTFIRLRRGEIRCLFTTNALMAGIDIGSLDVAIVKNFPGLVMNARQMFGRAGRAGEGAAIFLADRSDPFDQFYLERADLLFKGQVVEPVIVNPENPLLLASHLRCAAQMSTTPYRKNLEGPLAGEWAHLFGQIGADVLRGLEKRGVLRVVHGSYHLPLGNPHQEPPLDQLRMTEGQPYRLVDQNGELLEEKRRSHAYRDAHLDAIFWHNGRRYQVIQFDDERRSIVARQVEYYDDMRTQGIEEVNLSVRRELELPRSLTEGISVGFGEVTLVSRVDRYAVYRLTPVMCCRNRRCCYRTYNLDTHRCPKCGSRMRPDTEERLDEIKPVRQPPVLKIELETQASWLTFGQDIVQRFDKEFWPRWHQATTRSLKFKDDIYPNFDDALHSCKHAILKALPEQIRCDDGDIGGLIKNDAPERLYIYDAFPGGLGFAAQIYNEPLELLSAALARIEECTCTDDEGCLVCLKYFRCRQFNQGLSKLACRYLLRLALGQPVAPVLSDLKDYVNDVWPRERIAKP